MSRPATSTGRPKERVLVCGVIFDDQPVEHEGPLTEARGLVVASGAEVVGEGIVQRRDRPDPRTLMGRGKAEEIHAAVERWEPDAVVVDNDLSPAQVRNLEKIFGRRVVDRSELILDIFARRVQTRQSRLQVELAQVEYLIPRLRRLWTHLERQQGGIGMRGPGETQLETDRRLLLNRVRDLKAELATIEGRKRRQVRSRAEVYTLGLIGYTNAGKSTLLNALTGAGVLAEDMLFATLDTRTRQWRLADGRNVLVSDTVGFLQRLPHHLVASFHATLEEALAVDLLVHVIDASHPDVEQQMAAVDEVLGSLSQHRRADLLAFNKIDCIEEPLGLQLLAQDREEEVVFLSAREGEGLDRFAAAVAAHLDDRSHLVRATIPASAGALVARLRRAGRALEETWDEDGTLHLTLRLSPHAHGALVAEVEAEGAGGPRATFEILERAKEVPLARGAFGEPPESSEPSDGRPDWIRGAGTTDHGQHA